MSIGSTATRSRALAPSAAVETVYPLLGEHAFEALAQGVVVVDHQHPFGHGLSSTAPSSVRRPLQ